jgi:hypothetical protein
MLMSPVVLISSIVARDVLAGKWHFSLRALFICMTLLAIGLGLAVALTRLIDV